MTTRDRVARRRFLSRLGAGALVAGAGAVPLQAQSSSGPAAPWRPARHAEDDWLDRIPGVHRYVGDSTTAEGFGRAMFFFNNYIGVNQDAYGLTPDDLAVVLVVRHQSTPFAYNDAIWSKYGAVISGRIGFVDPNTKASPSTNLFNATGYGEALPNRGVLLDRVLHDGLRLAVCQVSTHGYASAIAAATGKKEEDVYKEILGNLVSPNAHMVPAGIVALNRAQERGYSFCWMG